MYSCFAVVRFTRPGFHQWPEPTEHRQYLKHPHRHLFHVEVRVEVKHDDREIEYHDLLDFCVEAFPGGDMGGQSCEMMARELSKKITLRWEGRVVTVKVFEDGEVGAELTFIPR